MWHLLTLLANTSCFTSIQKTTPLAAPKKPLRFQNDLMISTRAGAEIVGVSKDPVAKHEKFIDKHGLSVTLASDEDGKVCEAYGVWIEKNMYGRKYMGIQRATFLIGPDGKIEKVWPKVKVAGHADDVLSAISRLIFVNSLSICQA